MLIEFPFGVCEDFHTGDAECQRVTQQEWDELNRPESLRVGDQGDAYARNHGHSQLGGRNAEEPETGFTGRICMHDGTLFFQIYG